MRRLHRARMPLLCGILLLAACSRTEPTAPHGISPAVAAYLDEMIMVMQANSINRFIIDWSSFRAQVMQAGAGAQTVSEAHPGIRKALQLLGDNHSFYHSVGDEYLFERAFACEPTVIEAPIVPASIGYVSVGTFQGSSAEGAVFSKAIQQTIEAEDQKSPIGWIVDVRGNQGGNMWPMVAGIGPVLGEGIVGHFIDPIGIESTWSYNNGASMHNAIDVHRVSSPYTLRESAPRVAVLTDNAIGSSGEAVVIAFKERPNTRSFGLATCGLSTANRAFFLSDGAALYLTVSVMADRTKTIYGGPVVPDVMVIDQQAVVDSAVKWLEGFVGG